MLMGTFNDNRPHINVIIDVNKIRITYFTIKTQNNFLYEISCIDFGKKTKKKIIFLHEFLYELLPFQDFSVKTRRLKFRSSAGFCSILNLILILILSLIVFRCGFIWIFTSKSFFKLNNLKLDFIACFVDCVIVLSWILRGRIFSSSFQIFLSLLIWWVATPRKPRCDLII